MIENEEHIGELIDAFKKVCRQMNRRCDKCGACGCCDKIGGAQFQEYWTKETILNFLTKERE